VAADVSLSTPASLFAVHIANRQRPLPAWFKPAGTVFDVPLGPCKWHSQTACMTQINCDLFTRTLRQVLQPYYSIIWMSTADSAVLTFRRTSLEFATVPGIFPSP